MSDSAYLVIIGILLGFSLYMVLRPKIERRKRADGEIVVTTDPNSGKKTFSLELYTPPEELENMTDVSFKVIGKNGESR